MQQDDRRALARLGEVDVDAVGVHRPVRDREVGLGHWSVSLGVLQQPGDLGRMGAELVDNLPKSLACLGG